jgi:O-antigen/teichoic acid export membrane protein
MSESVTHLASPGIRLRTRLQQSVLWSLLGNVIGQGSMLVINIIVARMLGRELFGEYSIIQSTLITLTLLAPLATGFIATKYVAEFRATDKERAGRILGLCSAVSAFTGLLAASLLLIFARHLATNWFQAPHLARTLMLTAGAVFFTVQNAAQMGALAGLEAYRALATARIISGLVTLSLCALLAWQGGLNGAVAGLALSAVTQWFIFRNFQRAEASAQGLRISYENLWQERSVLLGFAIPAALSGISAMSAIWLTNSWLFRQPAGQAQMAIFTAAGNFRTAVLFLPGVINNVGFSLINHQKGLGDLARYRRVWLTNLALTTGIVITGSALIVLAGPQLLLLFGREFSAGSLILFFLMLSTVPEALAAGVAQLVQSQGRMWMFLLAAVVPRDLTLIAASLLLIPAAGAAGLARAYALAMSVMLLANLLLALALKSKERIQTGSDQQAH